MIQKKITDNRTFWRTVVPLFTSKPSKSENIINEDDKRISNEKKLCQIFHTFFAIVVSNLDIPNPNYFKEEKFHSISAIIEHFEKLSSVSNIKNKNFESIFFFFFKKTTPEEVVKVFRNSN